MSKLKLLLTGLAFAYKLLLVFYACGPFSHFTQICKRWCLFMYFEMRMSIVPPPPPPPKKKKKKKKKFIVPKITYYFLPPGHRVQHRQKPVQRLHSPPLKLNNILNRLLFVEVFSEQFLWFLKNFLLQFHHIFLLLDKSNPLIFQMCFIRSNIAYQCPNMIHFDVVDFRECHSEEVFDAQCSFDLSILWLIMLPNISGWEMKNGC